MLPLVALSDGGKLLGGAATCTQEKINFTSAENTNPPALRERAALQRRESPENTSGFSPCDTETSFWVALRFSAAIDPRQRSALAAEVSLLRISARLSTVPPTRPANRRYLYLSVKFSKSYFFELLFN